jgi:hypothetical protein
MKKNIDWTQEFNTLMDHLSKKKNESINDLEELKKKVVLKIDSRLDNLYQRRDYILEVLTKKNELRRHKMGVWRKFIRTNFWISIAYIFSMPFIYMMIIPGIFMHVLLEIYHQICFRIYRIPLVNPKEYFIFDRRHLPHLNWFEKFNCFYCSYYNCLSSYLQEIVGRTERFWCPIKHAKRMENPHAHYGKFVDYSDAENLRKEWKELRQFKELKK